VPLMLPVRRYIFFQLEFYSAGGASQPATADPGAGQGLVNSEQRRRLNRLVNRITKILSEAGKHKNQLIKTGRHWPLISRFDSSFDRFRMLQM